MGITLMEALEKAGYPRERMFNHNSDLYVFVTPVTTRVINDWCVAEGINKEEKSKLIATLMDQIKSQNPNFNGGIDAIRAALPKK